MTVTVPNYKPAPEGAARTVSQVPPGCGWASEGQQEPEIVWLMSPSAPHRTMMISDLEWFAMTPVLLQQFRMYYDSGDEKHPGKPIGVVLWAEVDSEVAGRLAQGVTKLRP